MNLPYAYISSKPIDIPKPRLNGGLYTGEPFKTGAPWANVPVIPDAGYMTNFNLRSANPPAAALFQYPGNIRPGNNHQTIPGVQVLSSEHALVCNTGKINSVESRKRFFEYAYL